MEIDIVLFGGARRVTLVEQIKAICVTYGISPHFFSVEKDSAFYPISYCAKVIPGPPFNSHDFFRLLETIYRRGGRETLFIACMDAAIPSLAQFANKNAGLTIIAPTPQGAEVALNKELTSQFCREFGIEQPASFVKEDVYDEKVIVKPKEGFGGKGIHVYSELSLVPNEIFYSHVVQEFVQGQETTHDVYIEKDGAVSIASRDRLSVIDGEVDHCIVRRPNMDEAALIESIARSSLFFGPITVQTIQSGTRCCLIEINARLGGGVTGAIEAGYPAIELLLHESFGIPTKRREFQSLEMKRARRDFYRILT